MSEVRCQIENFRSLHRVARRLRGDTRQEKVVVAKKSGLTLAMATVGRLRTLDAGVHQANEYVGRDHKSAPPGIKLRSGLDPNCFGQRLALPFEACNSLANSNQHVTKLAQLRAVAERSVARNDNC